MDNSNIIVNGLIILGKIAAVFFILGGILMGLSLIMYGMTSGKFNGEKTLATIDKNNIKCSQQVNFMMQPQLLCNVPLKYKVDDKDMSVTLDSIPNNMLNPDYPVRIEYNKKEPNKISLIMFDKKNSTSNMIMGVIIIFLAIYIGMWLYRNDSLSSVLGIGQLGRMIIA